MTRFGTTLHAHWVICRTAESSECLLCPRCRNFTDQGARDYWLDTVIEEVCQEHENHTGFTTVYFDEIDDNWCGYWGNATHGGCWFDNATQVAQAEASYSLYRLMVQKLNDCGIVPIMATFSYMQRSIDHGIDPTNPCMLISAVTPQQAPNVAAP
eukprot:COSAG02_NODE_13663_length_1365_cov_2.498420_1_plen_154_part_10